MRLKVEENETSKTEKIIVLKVTKNCVKFQRFYSYKNRCSSPGKFPPWA